jgi:hypothetical protein
MMWAYRLWREIQCLNSTTLLYPVALREHSFVLLLLLLLQYCECTDGSHIEVKASALVWHYGDADPDFGNWQVRRGSMHPTFTLRASFCQPKMHRTSTSVVCATRLRIEQGDADPDVGNWQVRRGSTLPMVLSLLLQRVLLASFCHPTVHRVSISGPLRIVKRML